MSQKLLVQDLVIVIAAKNHKPTILNLDFLKCTGIVPTEWELAREPIYTNKVAQVTFTNGINIVAEPTRIMFMEPIADKAIESLFIPGIASKYIQTLPNMEFEAVGINPRGYVPFTTEKDAARKYITDSLLSPGAWQSEGEAPMLATLNLVYKLNHNPFYLTVSEAALRGEDETITPIVMFSGSFSYEVSGDTQAEKLSNLHKAIENWQADLETYSNIVNTKFFANGNLDNVTVPDVFALSATT